MQARYGLADVISAYVACLNADRLADWFVSLGRFFDEISLDRSSMARNKNWGPGLVLSENLRRAATGVRIAMIRNRFCPRVRAIRFELYLPDILFLTYGSQLIAAEVRGQKVRDPVAVGRAKRRERERTHCKPAEPQRSPPKSLRF